MTAYIILTGTEDDDAAPPILGPFADHAAAEAFAASPQVLAWITSARQLHGGYPLAFVVSEQTATDPIAWMRDWSDDEAPV